MGRPKNFSRSQHHWMALWRGSIDDDVTCPYDPKHVMPYRRLLIHIIKCAKKHPELAAKLVTCPYSTLHRVPEEKLQDHLKDCPDHQLVVASRLAAGKKPYIEK